MISPYNDLRPGHHISLIYIPNSCIGLFSQVVFAMSVLDILSFPCSEGFVNERATVLGPAIEASLQLPGYLRYHHICFAYAAANVTDF
jgi:hypothetical protein